MFSGFSKKINLDHLGELVRSDFTYPSAKPNKPGFWNYYPKIRYENILSDEALKFFTTIKAIPKEGCLL
jgi:hypothetical protein